MWLRQLLSHIDVDLGTGWKWSRLFDFKDHSHLAFLGLSALFFFPIVYAQALYADDAFRIATGTYDWDLQGRPFANTVAKILSAGEGWIQDVTPLNWFISIFLIAVGGIAIRNRFADIEPMAFVPFLLGLVFVFNPFFLHNFLYRFDNVGMSLALLAVVLSFVSPRSLLGVIWSVFLLWFSLNLYQPFSNFFIALLAIEVLYRGSNRQHSGEIFSSLFLGLLALAFAYGLYVFSLNLSGSISNRMALLPMSLPGLIQVFDNLVAGHTLVIEFWQRSAIAIVVPGVFIPIAVGKAIFQRNWIFVMGLSLTLIMLFGAVLGFMALMSTQFLEPRAVAYFPAIMMVIVICLVFVAPGLRWLLVLPLAICLLFAYRVGSAHHHQSTFERPVFAQLAADIFRVSEAEQIVFEQVGGVPIAPNVQQIIARLPFDGFLSRPRWETYNRTAAFTGVDRHDFRWSWQRRNADSAFADYVEQGQAQLIEDASPYYTLYRAEQEGFVVWETLGRR